MKLFARYLNSTAVFSPPDENGGDTTTAEQQRKEIEVTTSHSENDEGNKNKKEAKDGGKDEDNDSSDTDDDNEDNEDNEDNSNELDNETPEQKAAREKEERKQARVQKRINKITADRDTLRAENERLKKQIEANPKEGLTEEEVERRATEKAKQLAAEEAFKTEQKEFKKRCDKIQSDAEKIDNTIEEKITDMVEELGPVPVSMVNILADLDNENGGAVLNYLTENIDEAEEIYEMTERRMAQRLIRISDKLKAEIEASKKDKDKQRRNGNKEPAEPIRTVNESGRNQSTQLTGNEDMETFIRIRNAQEDAKRKSRGFN